MDKGKRQINFPEIKWREDKRYKEDASGVGKTTISCLTASVLPTTHAAHVARGVTSEQLAAEQTTPHPGQKRKTIS